jgi:hypothetical protein
MSLKYEPSSEPHREHAGHGVGGRTGLDGAAEHEEEVRVGVGGAQRALRLRVEG